ncbi:MAG: hypothetical protein IKN17_01565 [Ruminococcus sp.]|nr:hypothetical protein [Ruminococcus sp.]
MATGIGYKDIVTMNLNPKGIAPRDTADTLINAVCYAEGISWKQSFMKLYEQAHKYCLLPTEAVCMKGMLTELGYVRQPAPQQGIGGAKFLEDFRKDFDITDTAVIRLSRTNSRCDPYAAVCRVKTDGKLRQALVSSSSDLRGIVREIWIKCSDESKLKKRSYSLNADRKGSYVTPKESETLHVVNENPEDKRIGDCVLRGVAACLGITWHEALDSIAEATGYAYPVFNRYGVFDKLLIKEGFEEKMPFRKDGSLMNGDEFCRYIRDMYPEGSVFLAEIGHSHVAAIRLLKDTYKIYDTWDSTSIRIIRFWVRYPERKTGPRPKPVPQQAAAQTASLPIVREGEKIKHLIYGVGTITNVTGGLAEVDFGAKGIKKLDEKWIVKNCKPI